MNYKINPQIVIIDDDIPESNYPLVDVLKLEYGNENVHIFAKPDDGVAYIEANLSKKIIVLLDVFFNGQPLGFNVFNEISKQSSLVCFIVMTGSYRSIEPANFEQLINKHAWYLIARDKPYMDIMTTIKKAENHIGSRVDGALEEWIMRHTAFKREQPHLKFSDGSTKSMNDILNEIRTGTKFGLEMQASILKVAVSRLYKEADAVNPDGTITENPSKP